MYTPQYKTIDEIFESGLTREPSVKALRTRAHEGILKFNHSVGNTYFFEETLSVIRVNAARSCKRPGITWSKISRAFKDISYSEEEMIKDLGRDRPVAEIIEKLRKELIVNIF